MSDEIAPHYTSEFEKITDECISTLLDLLNKDTIKTTEDGLRSALGWNPVYKESGPAKGIRVISLHTPEIEALHYLIENDQKKNAHSSPDFLDFKKKTKHFANALDQVISIFEDEKMTNFLIHLNDPDRHLPDNARLHYHSIKKLRFNLALFLHEPDSISKGRPNITIKLTEYIMQIALIYEKLSAQKFTIYRHPTITEDCKTYEPVTDGHNFIYALVKRLNKTAVLLGSSEVYTDMNIYNACETARKKMRKRIPAR